MKRLWFSLGLAALSVGAADSIKLSELNTQHIQQGWGSAGVNKSVSGGALMIGGKKFDHGIGTHANSSWLIDLAGAGEWFEAKVGVDQKVGSAGTVEFVVELDDKQVWSSGPMRGGEAAKVARVALKGAERMTLKVNGGPDGIASDHANWADAVIKYQGEKPKSVDGSLMFILTPPAPDTPRINSAQIFGVRPGAPFFFQVAASGKRPMRFKAAGLPAGLKINPKNGLITGKIQSAEEKTYQVKIKAENRLGHTLQKFRIKVGETISLTPPMGWNSWYASSVGVSAEDIKKVADAFVESGLRDYGWTYVNIDDAWQGIRDPKTKVLMGNERFPDFKELADYVHSKGLKLGIYSSPWIGTYAGFRGGSCDNADGTYLDNCLPEDKRQQVNQIYGGWPGFESFGVNRVGKHWFFDRDVKAMAAWGIDYIKVDWKPNDVPTTIRMAKDLRVAGRDIVLSLSNAAPLENAPGLSKWSNLWRTGGDIHDSWGSISRCFEASLPWQQYQSPGHWNDMDMLQVGQLGTPNRFNASARNTHLTYDEQYTHFSMWCLQSNPLLLSCYIDKLDAFTLALLTNNEVIAVNQDPLGAPAARKLKQGGTEVWKKAMEDGTWAVGIFNRDDQEKEISFDWSQIGLENVSRIRDLWRQKDEKAGATSYTVKVPAHGVHLIRVGK